MSEHLKVKKKSWLRDEISLDHLLPFFGNHIVSDVTPDLISKYKCLRLNGCAKRRKNGLDQNSKKSYI